MKLVVGYIFIVLCLSITASVIYRTFFKSNTSDKFSETLMVSLIGNVMGFSSIYMILGDIENQMLFSLIFSLFYSLVFLKIYPANNLFGS